MLTSVLEAAKPERGSAPDMLSVVVGTDIQADAVRRFAPQIKAFLHDRLDNDNIELDVKVCQGDIPPSFWTEQQVLEHLVAEHPAVATMISKYKMRLV